MSGANLEAVRQLLAAIADRDLDRLLALTAPEVEWRSFFGLGEGGAYRGHEAMPQYLRDIDEAFEVLRPEARDLLDVGDLVIGVGQVHYRGKGSGVETDAAAGWVFRFREGKVLRFRAFRDPEQTLEAVGLPA